MDVFIFLWQLYLAQELSGREGYFTTEDPARDGNNWYLYVGNNPLTRIDPSGLFKIDGDFTTGTIEENDKNLSDIISQYNDATGLEVDYETLLFHNGLENTKEGIKSALQPGTQLEMPVEWWVADESLKLWGASSNGMGDITFKNGSADVVFSKEVEGESIEMFQYSFDVRAEKEIGLGADLGEDNGGTVYRRLFLKNAPEEEVVNSYLGYFATVGFSFSTVIPMIGGFVGYTTGWDENNPGLDTSPDSWHGPTVTITNSFSMGITIGGLTVYSNPISKFFDGQVNGSIEANDKNWMNASEYLRRSYY